MIVCAYESRPSALPGLKLLLLSLAREAPGVPVDVTCPGLAGRLAPWLAERGLADVRLRDSRAWGGEGWSVKPSKILELLDEGHEHVVWIDTDVILHKDFRPALAAAPGEAFVVMQEFRRPRTSLTHHWTEAWGFECARPLPFMVNSGVLGCRPRHRPLLARWEELLREPAYLAQQALPVHQRRTGFVGDQDALTALLGSPEAADVPVHFLRCGVDVVQNSGANGYHAAERIGNLARGLPPFIHSLGARKPWHFPEVPPLRSRRRDHVALAILEVGPYTAVARRYAGLLGEPAPWLGVRTGLGRVLHHGTLGHPTLQGLPLALAAQVASLFGRRPRLEAAPPAASPGPRPGVRETASL